MTIPSEPQRVLLVGPQSTPAAETAVVADRDGRWQLEVARTPEQAAARLADCASGLLLDSGREPDGGVSFLNRLRALAPTAPVVALADWTGPEYGVRAAQVGLHDCVVRRDQADALVLPLMRQMIAQRRPGAPREPLLHGIHGVVSIADALARCPDLETTCRVAVERARAVLGLERCSIWLRTEDGGFRGTWGTGIDGQTLDERQARLAPDPFWTQQLGPYPLSQVRWVTIHQNYTEWHDGHCRCVGEGWTSSVPIRSGERLLGVFGNDAALTGAPFDEARQELVAVLSSLLATVLDWHTSQAALRTSERRLRTLVDSTPDLICLRDGDGRWTELNAAAARVFGVDRETCLGLTTAEVAALHPALATLPAESDRTDLATWRLGRASQTERRLPTPDSDRVYDLLKVPTFGGDGGRQGLLVLARDITERKRAEEALKRERDFTQAVLDQAGALVLVLDSQGCVVRFNRACEEATGYRFSEVAGRPFWERLIPPEDRALYETFFANPTAGPLPEAMEARWLTRDGRVRLAAWTARVMTDEQGQVAFLVAVGSDITEQRAAEQALRDSEARYRTLLDHAPEAVLVMDCDAGRVVDAGAGAAALFGCPGSELLGRSCFELFDTGGDAQALHEQAMALVRQALAGEVPVGQWRVRTASGELRPVEARLVRLPAQDRRLVRVSLTDVGERLAAEEEGRRLRTKLQQVQKLESLGVLAGDIAHDFNNLLTSILGSASLALVQVPDDSPARASLELIESAARGAADLTGQMLAYTGQGPTEVRRFDLSEVVRQMGKLLEVALPPGVVLDYQLAEDLPAVQADVTQVRQVVMNLITNAAEATGERGGRVTVRTELIEADAAYLAGTWLHEDQTPGPYVRLDVIDTGCGMDAATLERIFEPFFSTKFTGRGLGLAAVLGIVRSHAGAVRVDSRPGRGTRFEVLLPAQPEPAEPAPVVASPPAAARPPGGRGTLLLVDDEPSVLRTTARMVELLGFGVVTAAGGREALALFQTHGHRISAVLLDMKMPDLDGEQVFRALRALNPDVPVFLTSGYTETVAARGLLDEPQTGFIQKPYHLATLAEKLQTLG